MNDHSLLFVAVIYNKPTKNKLLKVIDDVQETWSSNSKPFILCDDFKINILDIMFDDMNKKD